MARSTTRGDDGDDDLTAWLCTHLPDLTGQPGHDRWAHKLDAAITAIRAGASTARALAEQHIPVDPGAAREEQATIIRGDPGTLTDLGIDLVAVTGNYTCPADPPARRCPRRAGPDSDGHEPRCGVHAHTMTLRRN